MGSQISQFFPPSPNFEEKDLDSLRDRVFLITGGTSGIGLELAKILYHAGGRVYITGCTEEKALQAVAAIRESVPESKSTSSADDAPGQIDFIILNLDDLASIKPSVEAFQAKETRLDVLSTTPVSPNHR
jgi:NAD(P)-dependent dehydrogenase (short-subunit alcohol dehydrogenase family)